MNTCRIGLQGAFSSGGTLGPRYEYRISSRYLRLRQADLNFIKQAREAAALINSATLQTEQNKAKGGAIMHYCYQVYYFDTLDCIGRRVV